LVYGPATDADEALKVLLEKPEWNEAECVAVVACPFTRFLTKEQQWLVVKRAAESEAEDLISRSKTDSKSSELQTVDSLLINLGQSLDRAYSNLSQPIFFERGDEQLQTNIAECSHLCQRRIRLQRRTRRIIFAAGLSLTVLCGLIALHVWLLGNTSLFFTFAFDGKDFPVGKSPTVTVDGKPFTSGDKIPLGHHQLTVESAGGEPFNKKFWSFYGKNDLGLLPLESSKGSLLVTVKPSPASVSVQRDGQLVKKVDAPFKLDNLPVGDYSLIIRRGEYEESNSVKVEREQQTKANIELNLGSVDFSSVPPDAEFELSGNGRHWQNKLPIHIDDVPAGDYQLITRRKGWELDENVTVNRGKISTEKVEFKYGTITVTSDPPGLTVSANGTEIGKTPTTLRELQPGKYALTVTDGENDLMADVNVAPKEAAKQNFVFRYGTVQLLSVPSGTTVIRKGKTIGRTPLTLDRIPTGETTVELQLQDYLSTNLVIHSTEGVTTELSARLISERYVQAMKQARETLDANQFEQASNSVAIAIATDPTDLSAATLLVEITQKAEASKQQQLEAERRAAKEKAEQLAAIPMLSPENIIKDCWYVPAKDHSATYDAAHSNPAAVPVAAATDVIVTGIKIIAWPFHKAEKEPRFDQGRFDNNYQNKVFRYYGKITNVDVNNKTLIFTLGGKSKQSYTVSAHLSDEINLSDFTLKPDSPVWVAGKLTALVESNPANHLVLDDSTVYSPNTMPADK
jgi:hypothetical protein